MIATLTQTRFERFRSVFRRTVEKTPSECVLTVTEHVAVNSFSTFVGDSQRLPSSYTLKCLYKREFEPFERKRFGLKDSITCVIWFAPEHLIEALGNFILDHRKLEITLHGLHYHSEKIVYRGNFYNSCIAVELHLIDEHES